MSAEPGPWALQKNDALELAYQSASYIDYNRSPSPGTSISHINPMRQPLRVSFYF